MKEQYEARIRGLQAERNILKSELGLARDKLKKAEQERDRWKDLYAAASRPPKPAVEGVNEEAWGKWVAYRKEIDKRPYKTTQVEKWLSQFPAQDQMEIVEQSLRNEWQGLHELKKSQQVRFGKPDIEETFL